MMTRLYTILARTFYKDKFPDRLLVKGRDKLPVSAFHEKDKLFHGFHKDEIDETTRRIKLETIRFPDFSCNWSGIAKPEDVWYRERGSINDGCYSITVKQARYKNTATPVHDVLFKPVENYAHVEIRQLKEGEDILSEPPRGRDLSSKTGHKRRMEYRNYIQKTYKVEIFAR